MQLGRAAGIQVYLLGHVVAEPLLRDVGDHPVATIACLSRHCWHVADGMPTTVAVGRIRLIAWEELAHDCGLHVHRGDRIAVVGQLRRAPADPDGTTSVEDDLILDRITRLPCVPPRDGTYGHVACVPTGYQTAVSLPPWSATTAHVVTRRS